jgi:hypothetical protein
MQRTGPSKAVSLAAAAMALLLATPAAVMAEPRALSASEMDGVTAGRIRVDATAFAQASGDFALARTRGDALVVTMDERELGVGFAEGLAFACCARESAVAVHSSVSSTGQIVHSDSHAVTFRGAIADSDGQVRYFTYGYAAAFLVARSPDEWPDAGAQAGHEPWDHLGEAVNGLIDVSQTRREGAISGFAFAPMLVAGIRWRLFRNFPAGPLTGSTSPTAMLRPSPAPFVRAGDTPFGVLP